MNTSSQMGACGRGAGVCRTLIIPVLMLLPGMGRADDKLEEVVVSARKRAENLQDVPISVSEVSGVELQDRAVVRVQDILSNMPNVSTDIQTPRQASLSIRGLGRNPANDALESSVAVFLDGVYLGRPGMMVADLVDLDRIEVLRGPQGTLFGKNATAGVINILTTPPAARPEGWLELSAGDHDLRELRGAASGPFGASRWSWRLSGFGAEREGFIHATLRDEYFGELQRVGGRAQLQWLPAADVSLRLIADYGSHDEAGPGYQRVDPNLLREDGTPRTTNLVTRAARFGYTPEFSPFDWRSDTDAAQRVATENAGATLIADWNAGKHRLSSITGWRKFNFRPENDGDYSALDVLPELGTDVQSWQLSEELRLASPSEGRFQYLAGVHFFEQHVHSDVFAIYGSDASEYLFPGLPADALDGFGVMTSADPQTRSYSMFGQTFWWPADVVEIATGLRWTTEAKSASVHRYTEGGLALAAGDAAAIQARQRLGAAQGYAVESDEDFVSGSLSITWHIDAHASAYLSAARAAKSGGVNAAILPAGADLTVDPEIALGYEAGLKTQWLEERLQWNLGVFHTTIDGYQASIRDRVVGASYLANAGEVSSSGLETEILYRPWSAITLTAAAGYNDARYESFRDAACPPELDNQESCDFTGDAVAGAPPLTLSGSVRYDAPLRALPSYRLRALLEYSYADGYRAELSRSTWIAAHDVVNIRLGAGTVDDRYSMIFWVLNLLDEEYLTGMALAGPANTGVTLGLLGAPRTAGLSFQLRY
jgi:iron complex outermembrane receptor protein